MGAKSARLWSRCPTTKLGALIGKLDAADALAVLPGSVGAAQIHRVHPTAFGQQHHMQTRNLTRQHLAQTAVHARLGSTDDHAGIQIGFRQLDGNSLGLPAQRDAGSASRCGRDFRTRLKILDALRAGQKRNVGAALHPQGMLWRLLGFNNVVAWQFHLVGESTALLKKFRQRHTAHRAVAKSNQQRATYPDRLARLSFDGKRLVGVQIEQPQRRCLVGQSAQLASRWRFVMFGSLGGTRSQFSCQPITANTDEDASRSIQPRSRPCTQNRR